MQDARSRYNMYQLYGQYWLVKWYIRKNTLNYSGVFMFNEKCYGLCKSGVESCINCLGVAWKELLFTVL
jgi:hypothetical protein